MTAGNFISALHEDIDRITEIVRDDMEDSTSFVMAKIPDGGEVIHNNQNDSIEYTAAKPAYMGYRNVDAAPRALVVGSMEAAACTGSNKSFTTNVNERDPNACGGLCEFKYGQGYRIYSSDDYELPMTTPEVCANDFIRMGDAHIDGYFTGLFESYRKYGMNNFEAELQNRVIEFGEANASIVSANHFQLTKGGFHAPPESRFTIHFALLYRDYMEYEDALSPEGYLEIEMPRQDWFDAVTEHQVRKNTMGGNISFNTEILKDETAELYARQFHIYENVKCYFNERPVRGYFKPDGVDSGTGNTQYSFVRVFPWINVVNEQGGVSAEPNHDYNAASTTCEGQKYPMVTLAFHIHNTAFMRFRLKEADKKAGESNVPTNFSMVIRDGAYIDNNDLNDKFKIVSRHAYRLKQWKLERAGAIAYRHSRPAGYIITPTDPTAEIVPEEFASPQQFDKCLPTAGEAANCAACDQVVNDNGDCVDEPGAAVVNMTPSGGEVTTVNDGSSQIVTLRLERTGTFAGASTVDYALSAIASAVSNTHYTADTGTVTFPDGDTSPQFIEVEILDGAGLDGINDGVKVTLSNPGGALTPTLEDTFVDIIIVDATA